MNWGGEVHPPPTPPAIPTLDKSLNESTYDDDDEVEPAPRVREILLEAIGHHLDDHLKDEDDGERTVGVVETDLEPRPLTDMNVLHCLQLGTFTPQPVLSHLIL